MNYYDLLFVSNSELTELHKTMHLIESPPNLQDIFNQGNLVDALITEVDRVNHEERTVSGGDLDGVVFELSEFEKAKAMRDVFLADPALNFLFAQMKMQYVYTRNKFKIEYEGFEFYLPVKCKFDGIIRRVIGSDIKTTAATSQNAFLYAVEFFNIDRQVAWYMDIAELDRFIVAGISKKVNKKTGKHDVYKLAIQRGDKYYQAGKRKYQRLAYLYYFLIYQFNQN